MSKTIISLVVVAILITIIFFFKRKPSDTGGCVSCSSKGHLLPLTDPAFNLPEVAKQMLLLEDHFSNRGKMCEQCIKKHSLTIEGYLEEALCLDSDKQYGEEINDVLDKFRGIEREFITGGNPQDLTRQVRDIRKQLHVKYFNVGI